MTGFTVFCCLIFSVWNIIIYCCCSSSLVTVSNENMICVSLQDITYFHGPRKGLLIFGAGVLISEEIWYDLKSLVDHCYVIMTTACWYGVAGCASWPPEAAAGWRGAEGRGWRKPAAPGAHGPAAPGADWGRSPRPTPTSAGEVCFSHSQSQSVAERGRPQTRDKGGHVKQHDFNCVEWSYTHYYCRI